MVIIVGLTLKSLNRKIALSLCMHDKQSISNETVLFIQWKLCEPWNIFEFISIKHFLVDTSCMYVCNCSLSYLMQAQIICLPKYTNNEKWICVRRNLSSDLGIIKCVVKSRDTSFSYFGIAGIDTDYIAQHNISSCGLRTEHFTFLSFIFVNTI